jgi:hypothetical protein
MKRKERMPRAEVCPVCGGKRCRQAPDGKSGYCNDVKRRWEVGKVPISELVVQPGPIENPELCEFEKGIFGWSYAVVGHYVKPTLEQWELGFMREQNIEREMICWHKITFAFVSWHRRKGLALRSREEERSLVDAFRAISLGGEQPDETIRWCWENPGGWGKEHERWEAMVDANHYEPPTHIDWQQYAKA